MRNLLLLSTIAVLPMRANADPCPRGHEPVQMQGAWTVCEPITDPMRCEQINTSICYAGMDFTTGSQVAACQRYLSVLNERCKANKAAAKAQAMSDAVCSETPRDGKACREAALEARRASDHARKVRADTERRSRVPIRGAGSGMSIVF